MVAIWRTGLVLAGLAAMAGVAGEGPAMLTVDRGAVACKSFLGFGVEWDPGFWLEWNLKQGVTEADWDLVVRRKEWMRVPVVRMMMQVKWSGLKDGKQDWECREMKNVYRYLDVCQKQGNTVLLTDWGCEPGWLRVPEIADVGDPKYAAAIGAYMDHLLNRKGYSCIRYFIMVNEPNYEVKDFNRWKKGVQNVWAEFVRRGLDKKVAFLGADESNDESWHRQAVDQLQSVLGGYDIHRYAAVDEVRSGRLLEFYRTQWAYALSKDPAAGGKPLIVGEAGVFSPGFSAGNNPLHLKYEYGLYLADYAAQAVGAGSWAVCAWMLEDSSHKDFNWGMWKGKAGGFELKPWFYPWSLLCRSVPAGSTVYRLAQSPDLRVLAASFPGQKAEGWTWVLVNRGEAARTVRLRVPGGPRASFGHYLYSREKAAADRDGFPVPVEEKEGDLGQGLEVSCPGNAVYFLTTKVR